jgi:hypothetical protein
MEKSNSANLQCKKYREETAGAESTLGKNLMNFSIPSAEFPPGEIAPFNNTEEA